MIWDFAKCYSRYSSGFGRNDASICDSKFVSKMKHLIYVEPIANNTLWPSLSTAAASALCFHDWVKLLMFVEFTAAAVQFQPSKFNILQKVAINTPDAAHVPFHQKIHLLMGGRHCHYRLLQSINKNNLNRFRKCMKLSEIVIWSEFGTIARTSHLHLHPKKATTKKNMVSQESAMWT